MALVGGVDARGTTLIRLSSHLSGSLLFWDLGVRSGLPTLPLQQHLLKRYVPTSQFSDGRHVLRRDSVLAPLSDGGDRDAKVSSYGRCPAALHVKPMIEHHGR